MTLSSLAIALGVLFSLPQIYALARPAEFAAAARKFPRSLPWGYALMGLATVWFLYNLNAESLSDFADYKKWMLICFGALGVCTCVFVKDFLAVRGFAIVLMLLAKLTLDTARWHDSQWRLVLAVWAYLWILAGMWFTISPWRLRDLIHWQTSDARRLKLASTLRLGFGLFVAILGFTAFR